MSYRQTIHPLRWLLLLWVSLVYLETLLSLYGSGTKVGTPPAQCSFHLIPIVSSCPLSGSLSFIVPLAVCSLLMLLYGTLLWASLAAKIAPRLLWFYFLVQGGLIFCIGLLIHEGSVVLSLYLSLTLGALVLLPRAQHTIIVAAGSLVLFIVSSLLSINLESSQDYWNAFLLIPILDYSALILFVIGYIVLHVQQRRAHADLEAAHVQLEATHTRLQASMQEIEKLTLLNERQRLARELHDTLAQDVAGLIMQLEAANAQLAQQHLPLAQNILQHAMSSARTTLATARTAIDNLRTMTSLQDFQAAIQDEVDRFQHMTGLVCHVEQALPDGISPTLYESIFRTIREGLANVAKHAQSRQVWIRMLSLEQSLIIEVQDDGIGFEPASVSTPGHYGLIGLRERALLTGGKLEVLSAPTGRTTIRLSIPNIYGGC
ncbi:histidine kinase [Ktedonobacteria bacterium brp13]|nr:histidine kinase [Ktedonobacteria bacterium brp13]